MRTALRIAVGILALTGVGASASFYFRDAYNPGFARFPILTGLHVVWGGVYLSLAPFQFVRSVRQRWPGYHRWVGRLLVATGMVVAATALFITLVIPFSDWESVLLSPFAVWFGVALANGYRHIRARRVRRHREWMTRALAIGLAIATMRLIFIPVLILIGSPTDAQVRASSLACFLVAFLLHAVVAELWIRRGRAENYESQGAPATESA